MVFAKKKLDVQQICYGKKAKFLIPEVNRILKSKYVSSLRVPGRSTADPPF